MTNAIAKKDPKTELQDLANWLVFEALRDPPASTNDEFSAVRGMFEEDCDAANVCATTLLINTAAQLTRAALQVQTVQTVQKPFPAPPLRVLSKLRPKV
jgi:hypothetical protein